MSGITPHALGVHRVLGALKPALGPLLDWASRRRLERAVNISDLRDAAKLRAHKMVFDYLDAGADDEITIRRNKDAYSQHELHYRVLAGLAPPLDLSTRILDRRVEVPFFPAPTAGSKMFHADGEVGVARAAAAHGAMYCLSTMATSSPAEVAAAVLTNPSSSNSTSGKTEDSFATCSRRPASTASTPSRSPSTSPGTATANATFETGSPFRQRTPSDRCSKPPADPRGPSIFSPTRSTPTPRWTSPPRRAQDERRRRLRGAPPEPDFPADRRAQVSFIRDAFDPSFDWDDAEWLCQGMGRSGPGGAERGRAAIGRGQGGGPRIRRRVGVESRRAAAGDGAGDGRRPLQRSRRVGRRGGVGGGEGGGGGGARRVGREGGERGAAAVATAGTTASTIDRPVSRADSHVSSCAAKAAVAAVAAAAPSAAVSAKRVYPWR